MRKLLAIILATFIIFMPTPAGAVSRDICTSDIVVGGLIKVKGTCVETDPLPLPSIRVPPIRVLAPPAVQEQPPSSAPTAPQQPQAPSQPNRQPQQSRATASQPDSPEPTATATQQQGAGTAQDQETPKTKETNTKQEPEAPERNDNTRNAVNISFYILSALAGAALFYLFFFRHNDSSKYLDKS